MHNWTSYKGQMVCMLRNLTHIEGVDKRLWNLAQELLSN